MSDHVSDGLFDEEPEPADARSGVDVLASGRARTPRPDARARLRASRWGTLIVLAITAALVAAGAWLVQRQGAQDSAAQSGGATVVKLPGTSGVPAPEVGKAAQDFTVTTYDGRQVTLSSLRGKPVWITFGASWCTGCQAEVPDIQAAYTAYAPKGVVVLGINITEDNAAVKAYATRVGLTYPLAADPSSTIADSYAVSAIQAHYFVNREGILLDIRQGSLSPAVMASILDRLVAP